MNSPALSVRELQPSDLEALIGYWFKSDAHFLKGMGVDLVKMPDKAKWEEMLKIQIITPLEAKQSYCLIWLCDGNPIGHSNANNIKIGESAAMHLHLWHPQERQRGFGTPLLRLTLPYFFQNLNLETLYCEPYALNPAPHKALEKVGFELVAEYTTTPGWINFEQPVKRWELTRDRFQQLYPIANLAHPF